MNKIVASQMRNTMARRLFATYNYSAATNPKVFLQVSKNGQSQGKMVFELYENHAPALTFNFQAFCNGTADKQRTYVGTTLSKGMAGLGIMGGDLHEEENLGAGCARLPDENLEIRHFKRGMLSMLNDGSHKNGSQFCVTFGEASYLDGYQNVIGELVEGDSLLRDIEATVDRDGKVSQEWVISDAGTQH